MPRRNENVTAIFFKNHKTKLEDRIHRAYGVLKNAYLISSQETVELLSMVRLGFDLGVIVDVDRRNTNDLFILIQPAHLQKIVSRKLSTEERDKIRAELIRDKILGKK